MGSRRAASREEGDVTDDVTIAPGFSSRPRLPVSFPEQWVEANPEVGPEVEGKPEAGPEACPEADTKSEVGPEAVPEAEANPEVAPEAAILRWWVSWRRLSFL